MSGLDHAERIDVLVIGAGVAGASAALSAARALDGRARVLLVERADWPRQKVCGCCLGAHGVASIRRLGLDLRATPADCIALDRIRVTARGGASFSLPHAGGLVITRLVLDAALASAAVEAGAEFRPRCAAGVIRRVGDAWHTTLGGRACLARTVIVADGLAGRSLADLPEFAARVKRGAYMGAGLRLSASAVPSDVAPAGTVQMVHGVGGYVGLVRCADRTVDVAAALHPQRVRSLGGPIRTMQRLLDEARVPVELDSDCRAMGAPLLTKRRDVLGAPGLIIAGDAAGYVEPFTGEGMTWAALAGEHAGALAAHAIECGASGVQSLGEAWSRWYRRELAPMQRACASIRLLLRVPGMLPAIANISARSRVARGLLCGISERVTGGSSGGNPGGVSRGVTGRGGSMPSRRLRASSRWPAGAACGSGA